MVTGAKAVEACININLFYGLGDSIEGAIHDTMDDYEKAQFPPVTYKALLERRDASYKGGGRC